LRTPQQQQQQQSHTYQPPSAQQQRQTQHQQRLEQSYGQRQQHIQQHQERQRQQQLAPRPTQGSEIQEGGKRYRSYADYKANVEQPRSEYMTPGGRTSQQQRQQDTHPLSHEVPSLKTPAQQGQLGHPPSQTGTQPSAQHPAAPTTPTHPTTPSTGTTAAGGGVGASTIPKGYTQGQSTTLNNLTPRHTHQGPYEPGGSDSPVTYGSTHRTGTTWGKEDTHLGDALGGATAKNAQYTVNAKVHVGDIDQKAWDSSGHDPRIEFKSGVGIGHHAPGVGGTGGIFLAGKNAGTGLSEVEGNQTTQQKQAPAGGSISGQLAGQDLYIKQNVTIQGGNRVYDTYVGKNQNDMQHMGHTEIANTDRNATDSRSPLQLEIRADGLVPNTTHLVGPVTVAPLTGSGGGGGGDGGHQVYTGGGGGGGGDGGQQQYGDGGGGGGSNGGNYFGPSGYYDDYPAIADDVNMGYYELEEY
jgi:hypothetical protein